MLHAAPAAPPAPSFHDPAPDSQASLFRTLLDADAAVDECKLRRAAASGVPPHVRPLVWRLLLGITAFNSIHAVANEQDRSRDYASISVDADAHEDVARRIRAVLKRSRSAYQPQSTHYRTSSRQPGSTSGESLEDEEEDESTPSVQEPAVGNGSASSNGRAVSYVREARHAKVRIVDREILASFTRVINTYLNGIGNGLEFHSDMVQLCALFIELMPTEADAFYAFSALMQRHQHLFTDNGIQEAASEFVTMFRALHQDLYDHFVAEEVNMNAWIRKWLRGLLAQQLPRRALLRLWDSYFASSEREGVHLHPYVCLVFIDHIKPELQDCDDGERITSLLEKLPAVNIDRVIAHALTTREQLRERGVL